MNNKEFEDEYRKLKKQAVPDLWNRIEPNLKEHPEQRQVVHKIPIRKQLGGLTAVAAATVFLVLGTVNYQRENAGKTSTVMNQDLDGITATTEAYAHENVELVAYQPLKVPDQAVTVPEDTQYFSEAILGDTELLCGGRVVKAELEEDVSGRAVKVVYEIEIDKIYYAEDYMTNIKTITVKSPIVKTEGDEAYILYQLQKDGVYLLPLKTEEGHWELLYPFAPQVQIVEEGAYLFHSGYVNLVNNNTSVVAGEQEGMNDYYYDRMRLRNDDEFIYEFISLVEEMRNKGGEKNEKKTDN